MSVFIDRDLLCSINCLHSEISIIECGSSVPNGVLSQIDKRIIPKNVFPNEIFFQIATVEVTSYSLSTRKVQ